MKRLFAAAAMITFAWGATMGAAEARDPTPLPAEYPDTGPTTTTTTIAVVPNYPETSPTTTAPPPTTTTAPPPVPEPAPPTTTTPPPPAPRPTAPTPNIEPENEGDDGAGDVEPERLLDGSTTIVYETAEEHSIAFANVVVTGADSYGIVSAPEDVRVTPGGMVQWRPTEDHGGRTVVISVIAEAADGSHARVDVHFLVAETNTEPEVIAPAVFRGFPGKTTEATFTFVDPDLPENTHRWSVAGHAGLEIDQTGTVSWTLPDDAAPGFVEVTVSVTDDGDPAERGSLTLMAEIVDTSAAAVMAVDAEGNPVNPMVIGAGADAPAMLVDLDQPAQLMSALAERTPAPATARAATNSRVAKATGALENTIVVQSVQETLGVLLQLEVPTTAVAGGLAWQLALLIAPATFGRSRKVYDIVGVSPGAEIGDERFRFRSDATGLEAGPLRRKGGTWMRAVESPYGDVWIPATNLRAAGRSGPGALEVRLAN